MYSVFVVNSECDDALWEESRKMMHDNKDDDEIEDKQGESKKKGGYVCPREVKNDMEGEAK